MTSETLKLAHAANLMPTYSPFDVVLTEGSGAIATDIDGKTYIDFGSGIGVNSLGFADEEWVHAVSDQLQNLQHASNLYYTAPAIGLAEDLCKDSPFAAVFFGNSGAEANECAIKVARKASFDRYGEHRHDIICLVDSFHGRTLSTLAATGQAAMHPTFAPLPEGFRYVPANDIKALKGAIGPTTCAVMLECVQGEGGVNIVEKDFLQAVDALCKENDLLFIIDEIQTGIGRTGKLFAFEHAGITPDVITLAKGLGGGLPIGACLVSEKWRNVMGPGTHGSTFGGNPVVCAGARVVLKRIANPAFLQKVSAKGAFLESLLEDIQGIDEISRLGLMVGFTLKDKKAGDVLNAALKEGLLVLTAKNKIRLLPPLTISEKELQDGAAILKAVIDG